MKTVISQLNRESLLALAHSDALAIQVAGFLTPQECLAIAAMVENSAQFRYDGTGFRGLGPGSFALPAMANEYFGSADEVMAILDSVWVAIAETVPELRSPHFAETPMRPLTARRYDSAFAAVPHQDRDLERYPWATSQLGISLQIRSPRQGGAIQLWDLSLSDEDYQNLALADGFGLDEALIPPPSLEVFGAEGDLLVLDARRIHAIKRITDGDRLSVSGFFTPTASDVLVWS